MKQQDKIVVAIILAGLIIGAFTFLGIYISKPLQPISGSVIKFIESDNQKTTSTEPDYKNIHDEELKEDVELDSEVDIFSLPIEQTIVTKVIDGDTVELNSGERVRLICIDAPERGEEWYDKAKSFLEDLVLNKEVRLEKDITNRDKYNRLLRYIYTKEGIFVDELIVFEGYARAYIYEPDTRLCPQIVEAEKIARTQNKGMWQDITGDNCVDLGCPEGTIYVGSKNSDKYHECSCRYAKNIAEKNLNCFTSRKDAQRQEYVGCKRCDP